MTSLMSKNGQYLLFDTGIETSTDIGIITFDLFKVVYQDSFEHPWLLEKGLRKKELLYIDAKVNEQVTQKASYLIRSLCEAYDVSLHHLRRGDAYHFYTHIQHQFMRPENAASNKYFKEIHSLTHFGIQQIRLLKAYTSYLDSMISINTQ